MELLKWAFVSLANGIFHVGAHRGQEAAVYDRIRKPVLWVEAIPEIADSLEESVGALYRQFVVCACLSSRDGSEVQFHIASNDGQSSSLYPFKGGRSGPGALWPDQDLHMSSTRTLVTRTVDSILTEANLGLANLDHWIVDVQGAELDVLRGATRSMARCRSMLVETSSLNIYDGGAHFDEVCGFLKGQGFTNLWEASGHMDVLFVRTSSM